MSDTIRVSRELLEDVIGIGPMRCLKACDEIRALLSKPAADCGLEVVGYFFQHEETGQVMIVDAQQVEWGFEKNNPRLVNMGAIIRKSDADALQSELNEARTSIAHLLIELDELKAPRHGHCNHGPEKTCGRCTADEGKA